MKQTLYTAIHSAGQILMSYFGKITDYTVKESQSSIVTRADLESEEKIMQIIKGNFPDHNTIGEETGFQDKGSEFTWVVDPLDGTSNFAAGLPWFGIIICLLKNAELYMAGCSLPYYNNVYFAEKGKGATLNGQPIFVSKETNLKNVLFSYGLDYSDDFSLTDFHSKIFRELVKNTRNIRATNCLLDFCYTADGRLGGCINQITKIWDIAGPQLIIEEAGGVFTNTDGTPIKYSLNKTNYNKNYTVAGSNKVLHPQIIELIKNTGK
ncbi:MAG: inositol monophosphatase [Prolixibacteraceae bacterium]|nr:inositol monophosphatase [Prolixibacteraceae bacterium]MBN2774608.1 inositol monophosphatase [Prolixibacteraceae bacterium]